MLRKISRNVLAWLVVVMTVCGMTRINTTTANAEGDSDQCSVVFSDVTYDVNTKLYSITGPTVNIPTGKTVKYVTINVSNGTFDTSSVTSYGAHHYNYGGSAASAYSDLIILNSNYADESSIINLFTSLKFKYDSTKNTDSSKDGIAIYATVSTNEISLPSTNFSFYQVPGTDHYYMYVPGTSNVSWHEAYNGAKSIVFGGLRGYLATVTSKEENDIMQKINGTTYAWVGGTSIYYVPSGDADSAQSTWTKINDATNLDPQPETGAYATKHGAGSASNLYADYYWADGPEAGSTIDKSLWESGEPNGAGTISGSSLKRATNDYTSTEDCVLTNWNGKMLNDYAETHALQGYFVEFTADASYANGFSSNYTTWSKGNANASFTATTKTASLADTTNQVAIKKFLVMDDTAYTPNVQFSYTISAASGSSDGKVYAGDASLKVYGTPSVGTANFTANQTTYNADTYTTQVDDTNVSTADLAAVNLGSGQKFAVSNFVVSFNGVNFTEPGIYRYTVTESPSNLTYIQNDTTTSLILDVYVSSNDGDDMLAVTGYVLHASASDDVWSDNGGLSSTSKVSGFVNRYLTQTLTVKKEVSGNQSRTDQYFDFNISISNATAGSIYDVGLPGAADESGSASVTRMTAGTNGTTKGTVYLKAGESFTIYGLAKGTAYSVGENTDTLDSTGYTSSLKSSEGDTINGLSGSTALSMDSSTMLVSDSGLTANTNLVINNDKTGIIPTGVIVAVAPYATIALCGFAGLIVFARHKKNKDEDEEDQQ